jgi:hypothetical protein
VERVAFLIERTNEHISCLLNPEDLILRRVAGIRARQSIGGHLTGNGLSDDPLIYTGGGHTEIVLNLLFDTQIAGSTVETDDVRNLTSPLWNLTENRQDINGLLIPPQVRFLWGRHWNIPCVIVSISERLDDFTAQAAPQRSWLRMKMLRVQDEVESAQAQQPTALEMLSEIADPSDLQEWEAAVAEGDVTYHEIMQGDRLDDLAMRYYGDPGYWRLLALFNNVRNPNELDPGSVLVAPPTPQVVWRLIQSSGAESDDTLLFPFSSIRRFDPLTMLRTRL